MRFKQSRWSANASILAVLALASSILANPVRAQVLLPAPGLNDGDAALHGAGTVEVANSLTRMFNCIGIDQKLALGYPGQLGAAATAGLLRTTSAGTYDPASPDTANPALRCGFLDSSASSTNIQPKFSAKYVAIDSAFALRAWSEYKDLFDGAATGGLAKRFNPFATINHDARWSHLQFAISTAPLDPGTLTNYNTGGTNAEAGTYTGAAAAAGPAVQFPLFIVPVALVYNPTYGTNAAGTAMVFNTQYTGTINNNAYAAIRLTRPLYCGIFNGDIVNWNDPRFASANRKTSLRDPVNDTAARWDSDGVPIRLVGRMDNGDVTAILTRHLAAVCALQGNTVTANKYERAADSLPYNASSLVNLTNLRPDSNYKPTASASVFAGSTNMVSASYWIDSTKVIAHNAAGPRATPVGNKGSGLFLMANGGQALANAVAAAPDYALNGVLLNGKIGYVGGEQIPPSFNAPAGLASAILQIGTTVQFAPPSVRAATKAFGTGTTALLPPQSSSTGELITDTRLVRNAAGTTEVATRANPLAWTDVLYTPAGGNTLAAPLDGYPITGTGQFLGYTCYLSGNRQAIVEMLGLMLGQIVQNSANAPVARPVFRGDVYSQLGIAPQSNIAMVPAAWRTAITETFLQKGTKPAGALGLWIQSAVTTKPAIVGKRAQIDTTANPLCTGKDGA